MAKKVTNKDIFSGDLFNEAIAKAEKLNDILKAEIDLNKELLKQSKERLKVLKIDVDGVKELEKAVSDVNKVVEKNKKLEEASRKISAETTKIRQEKAKALTAEEKALERLEKAQSDEGKRIAEINLQIQEQNKQNKELAKEKLKLIDTYTKESKRLNALRKELKNVTLEQGKGSKEAKRLRKEVERLDAELKDVDASAGQFQRNVGNYPESLGKGTKAILGMAAAAAGLSVSLDSVKTALNSTDDGADELAEAGGFLEGVFTSLRQKAGQFTSGLIDLVRGGQGIAGIGRAFDKIGGSLENVVDDALKSGDAFTKAAADARELEKELVLLDQAVQDLTSQINIQNQIAGDSTKSFDEIAEAAKNATRLEVERSLILVDVKQRELDIINAKIAAIGEEGNTLALQQEATQKSIELSQLQNELELARLENNKIIQEVERDRFERQLDFAIDAFDAEKTVNERIIADQNKTLKERGALFSETVRLANSSYQSQIDLVEDYTKQKINFDELVNESDEKVIRQKLESVATDDIVLGRILEIIRERKLALQDLAEAERDLIEESKENAAERVEFINQLEQSEIEGRIEGLERVREALIANGEDTQQINEEIFELRRRQLIDQAEFEISLEGKTAEEIELIRQNLANELARLGDEEQERELARLEELEKKREESIDKAIANVNRLFEVLEMLSEKEIEDINDKISANDKALEVQERRAEQGLDNELAFRQQRRAELEREQEEAQKKAERRAKILAYFNLVAEYAKENPNTAPVKAFAQAAIAEAIAGSFIEGTKDTVEGDLGGGAKFTNTGVDDYLGQTKSGKLFKFDGAEKIFNPEQSRLIGNLDNDTVAQLAFRHRQGKTNTTVVPVFNDNNIVAKLNDVEKKLENIGFHVSWDEQGRVVEKTVHNGMKKTIKHLNTRPRI